MKPFAEGVDELIGLVGTGTLQAEITVNQVYAHYQDDGYGPHGKPAQAFEHPRGGEANYLSGQFRNEQRMNVLSQWASHVLDGRLISTTIDLARAIKDQVYFRAPREFEFLRNSAAVRVDDDQFLAFFEPAMVPRLSEAEIKAIRRTAVPVRTGGRSYGFRRQ